MIRRKLATVVTAGAFAFGALLAGIGTASAATSAGTGYHESGQHDNGIELTGHHDSGIEVNGHFDGG